ncbi:MAG: phosphohydrolase [Deltaproteobacteria bacterium]|nr:MAG: phosphohydrolase [Deltaproteobacteria bacterium]
MRPLSRHMKYNRFIQELYQLAEPYLRMRIDFIHTQVAHGYALLLLEKESGDRKIVEPAIILHDIGWSALRPEDIEAAYGVRATGEKARKLNRIHEVKGAGIAQEILLKIGCDTLTISKITKIIERHDSGKKPCTLEEKIVKDADKLWRFSKIGYAHELKRQALTHEVRYAFLSKNIDNWFFTKTAKTLAEKELQERDRE